MSRTPSPTDKLFIFVTCSGTAIKILITVATDWVRRHCAKQKFTVLNCVASGDVEDAVPYKQDSINIAGVVSFSVRRGRDEYLRINGGYLALLLILR